MDEDRIKASAGYYDLALQNKELADYCMNSSRYKQAIPLDYYYIFNLCRLIYSVEYEDTSKHKTLLGEFNRIYVHEKKAIPSEYGSFLNSLEKQRGLCDYEANYSLDKDLAQYLHKKADEFGKILVEYIKSECAEIAKVIGI